MTTKIDIHSFRFAPLKVLAVCIGIMTLTSCQEPLNVDYTGVADESLLMVDGKITTDTTRHYVFLSRTTPLNTSKQVWETGATVKIVNGNNIIPLSEEEDGHYYTEANVYGVIGERYELQIELENGDTYNAST